MLYPVLFATLAAADQASKAWATLALEYGVPTRFGPFTVTLLHNTGLAGSDHGDVLSQWLRAGATGGALLMLMLAIRVLGPRLSARHASARVTLLGLVVMSAGGAGNFVDRALRPAGTVIDFISLSAAGTPACNLADIFALLGALIATIGCWWWTLSRRSGHVPGEKMVGRGAIAV